MLVDHCSGTSNRAVEPLPRAVAVVDLRYQSVRPMCIPDSRDHEGLSSSPGRVFIYVAVVCFRCSWQACLPLRVARLLHSQISFRQCWPIHYLSYLSSICQPRRRLGCEFIVTGGVVSVLRSKTFSITIARLESRQCCYN